MVKDITTNASGIPCFTPTVTGWHHFSIHADSSAKTEDGTTSAALTFSNAKITVNQLGTALHADLTEVATPGVVGVAVNLLADSPVTVTCASGTSHKVRVEAHPMKIA